MNTLTKIFLLSLLISMAAALSVVSDQGEDFPSWEADENDNEEELVDEAAASSDDDSSTIQLRGIGRFLAESRILATANCNVNHKICKLKGSPRQDCCNNKCVDSSSDHLNCGKCGHKCSFSHTCCKGKCVNPMTDRDNCGSCSNKCQHHDHKKTQCVFGMCSYA